MSAGKCKRGPENPLGATSSSSSGSDDDSPRHGVTSLATSKAALPSSVQQPQHHQPAVTHLQQQLSSQSLQLSGSLSPPPAASAHNLPVATMPIGSTTAMHDVDAADYDAASSPSGSSTLSGSTFYVRQPGFTEHAHTHRLQQSARRPRIKKKKSSVVRGVGGGGSVASGDEDVEDFMVTAVPSSSSPGGAAVVSSCSGSIEVLSPRPQQQQQQGCLTSRQPAIRQSVVTRSKPHRDPIPMRMRALPQSMWQEPNIPHNVSPATVYPVLPPLVTREGDDITSLRPVTPPDDRDEYSVRTDRVASWDKAPAVKMTTSDLRRHGHSQHPQSRHQFQQQPGERIISVAQPELLQQLFDVLNKEQNGKPSTHRSFGNHAKKVSSGGKKVMMAPNFRTSLLTGHDPYMVDNIAESLFPQLSLERGGGVGGNGSSTSRLSGACGSGTQMVHLQPLSVGDKMIMLPSLIVDQNYPQMLSELVANM